MSPPLPPEEITQLMQWLAGKAKNATSPLIISELCRQFKKETGTLVSVINVESRIKRYRLKIHKMDEFDMETKVKMMFALSAPIDAGFLVELKKVAAVEVDDKQRIIYYEQKDGKLELNKKRSKLSMNQRRQGGMIQLLAEKTKTVDFPMIDRVFLREFKENNGCLDSIDYLVDRYECVKKTIFESSEFDKNTKVKMMFISNAQLSGYILKQLQKDATVKLDNQRMIKKYKANDGSLELKGNHSMSAKVKAAIADMKKKSNIVVVSSSDSEEDEENRKKRGRKFDQAPTSLPTRAKTPKGRKRAREVSEEDYVEKSLKVENDWLMNFDTNNAEDFDYALEPTEHIPEEKNLENLLEIKEEEVPEQSLTTSSGDHFFFDYDPPTYEDDLDHIPEEKNPEVHKEPSNLEYHYEEHLEHVLIEPKPEII